MIESSRLLGETVSRFCRLRNRALSEFNSTGVQQGYVDREIVAEYDRVEYVSANKATARMQVSLDLNNEAKPFGSMSCELTSADYTIQIDQQLIECTAAECD